MTPSDLVLTIVAGALILGGTVAFKAWLSHRTDVRKAEIEKDTKKDWLEAQKAHYAHDTHRYSLLVEAIKHQPVLDDAEEVASSSRNEITKAIGEERGGSAFGVELSPEVASELVSQKRQQGTPTDFRGVYRVSRVDTTAPDGFRVTLTDIETGEDITASLQDALVSENHRQAIEAAEWSKRSIRVHIKARLLRNRFVDAVVLSAEPVAPQTAD